MALSRCARLQDDHRFVQVVGIAVDLPACTERFGEMVGVHGGPRRPAAVADRGAGGIHRLHEDIGLRDAALHAPDQAQGKTFAERRLVGRSGG
jgi:hypothetical protein